MKAFFTMLKTEMKLSLRGMDMFIFAICICGSYFHSALPSYAAIAASQ